MPSYEIFSYSGSYFLWIRKLNGRYVVDLESHFNQLESISLAAAGEKQAALFLFAVHSGTVETTMATLKVVEDDETT